jgi:hypothetical protein
MAASMRAKKTVIHKLYTQFKMYGLTTDVPYTDYLLTVGASDAIPVRAIAKGWRGRWPVVMSQLKTMFPDVNEIVNKVEPEPVVEVQKLSGLEALKALSAKREEEDGKDF